MSLFHNLVDRCELKSDFLVHFLHFRSFERLNSDLFQPGRTMTIEEIFILYVRLDDVLLSTPMMRRTRKNETFGHTFCDSQREDRDSDDRGG